MASAHAPSREGSIAAVRQADGRLGIRRHVLVLPATINTSPIADRIADGRPRLVSAAHDHGRGQFGADADLTRNVLVGMGRHPNVAGTVVVGSSTDAWVTGLRDQVAPVPARLVDTADGCYRSWIEAGEAATDELIDQLGAGRESVGLDSLVVGLVASDLAQSTVRTVHPLIADALTELVDRGARVLVAGVDRLLPFPDETRAAVADRPSVDRLFAKTADAPPRHRLVGLRVRASGFDDVTGFLGELGIDRVMECGDAVEPGPGVTVLDVSSRFEEATTALAAAGAHLVVHLTATGATAGHPVVPVITVSGDDETLAAIPEAIDLDARTTDPATVLSTIRHVASGDHTATERTGLTTVAIPRIGPTL